MERRGGGDLGQGTRLAADVEARVSKRRRLHARVWSPPVFEPVGMVGTIDGPTTTLCRATELKIQTSL